MNMTDGADQQGIEVSPYARLISVPVFSQNIFHFPLGIPAFENSKEFIFLLKPDTSPFLFMHALQPSDLAFVCIDPFLIMPDYKPKISEADRMTLNAGKSDDILLLTLVTVSYDIRQTTTNLQAPIAINMQTNIGKQIICDGQSYPVRFKIWDALNMLSRKEKEKKQTETQIQIAG